MRFPRCRGRIYDEIHELERLHICLILQIAPQSSPTSRLFSSRFISVRLKLHCAIGYAVYRKSNPARHVANQPHPCQSEVQRSMSLVCRPFSSKHFIPTKNTSSEATAPSKRAAVGIVLVVAALRLLGLGGLLGFSTTPGARLWTWLRPLQRRVLLSTDGPGKRIALGMLWGWMPCGLST